MLEVKRKGGKEMANLFQAVEIVDVAVRIEKNGFAFYSEVARQASNFAVKEVFDYLAKAEKQHILDFDNLGKDLEKYEPPESYPGEYALYMQALAEENVFTKDNAMKTLAKKVAQVDEAIGIGIGFEKDSIIFFSEMKKFVPASGQKTIDNLVEQEKEHLRKLLELKQRKEV
jgi:rubrerythrin